MIYFIRARIIQFIVLLTAAGGVLTAVDQIFRPSIFNVLLLLFPLMPLLSRKGNWYLLWPCSRARLMVIHFFESVVMVGFALALTTILYLIHARTGGSGDLSLKLILYIGGTIGALRSILPVLNPDQRSAKKFPLEQNGRKDSAKRIAIAVSCFAAVMLLLKYDLFEEPMVLTIIFTYTIAAMLLSPMILVVLPIKTFHRLRKAVFVGATGIILALFAAVVIFSLVGPPGSPATTLAIGLLGRTPVSWSNERIIELAMDSENLVWPRSAKVNEEIREAISVDLWNRKLARCKTPNCLNISNLMIPSRLPAAERLDRFFKTMEHCDPGLIQTSIRCRGFRPSNFVLEDWLKELRQSEVVDRWLESKEPLKQFIAIRALSWQKPTSNQEQLIQKLQQSDVVEVRKAAQLYFTLYSTPAEAGTLSENCDNVCRATLF